MIVGLTGGIGSGKTTVAGFFEKHGVPVYIADKAAKQLMVNDYKIVETITALLGNEAYDNGTLNTAYIAKCVFSNKAMLQSLNAIVHPAVQLDFEKWAQKQKTPYVMKEAAILFEKQGYKKCDYTILVTAPLNVRIDRVMRRDKTTREEVERRIAAQWSDYKKSALADAAIENISLDSTQDSVDRLHTHLLRRIAQKW